MRKDPKGFDLGKWGLLILLTALIPFIGTAQNLPIVSGTITNDFGDPLIGATVSVKNTQYGAYSQEEGKYSLPLTTGSSSYELVFSYVGFATETRTVTVNGPGVINLNVQLSPDVTELDEVVITGVSAATSRKQLGNAISTINAEELSNSGSVNVLGALSGKVLPRH